MSTQEIKKVVKERDQALSEKTDLQKVLDLKDGAMAKLNAEHDSLKKEAMSLKTTIKINGVTIDTLRKELDEAKKGGASAEKISVIEKDLKAAKAKLSANKVAFHYDNMVKGLDDLLKEITGIAASDPKTHAKYKNELSLLLQKTGQRLGG